MKARKFIKRDRTTVGIATGTLICRLLIPVTEEDYVWRTTTTNPARTVSSIRKFVERHLPINPETIKGSSFVIDAVVRASPNRLGRKRLAKWKFGDDLTSTYEKASQEWELLKLEEDYVEVEVDLEL